MQQKTHDFVLVVVCILGSLATVVYIGLCHSQEGLSPEHLGRQLAKYDEPEAKRVVNDEEYSSSSSSSSSSLQQPLLVDLA